MPRFFFVHERISSSPYVVLCAEEANHLRVMRLKAGDTIFITDGYGYRYKALLVELGRAKAVLKTLGKDSLPESRRPIIILGQVIPRFSKIEFILQKATELGVDRICPLKAERSFLAHNKALSQNRWKRWERIVLETAKQSGRIQLPALASPQTMDSFLKENLEVNLKICLWEGEDKAQSLRDLLKTQKRPESVSILIGPEGSFSQDEIKRIKASGYQTVLCGPRIMRVETAAITCIAIFQYEWGDL